MVNTPGLWFYPKISQAFLSPKPREREGQISLVSSQVSERVAIYTRGLSLFPKIHFIFKNGRRLEFAAVKTNKSVKELDNSGIVVKKADYLLQ
jgi:hypothetical protein